MLTNFANRIRKIIRPFKSLHRLKINKFKVAFLLEGGLEIHLPYMSYLELFSKSKREFLQQCFEYSRRPNSEALLRKIVYFLVRSEAIDASKSVIDIGSWLADNATIWAMLLKGGKIWAIDPSQENLQFGMKIAALNKINNIEWVKAVCSDKANIPLAIAEGSCAHASFKNADNAQHGQYLSTTLDEIIPDGSHGDISMIHIDVEGFEQKVILGASDIIRKSKPVIIFEQHISNEDPSFIFNFLKGQGYGVYMINEVLPGNELDCRNFIAFSSSKPLPPLPLLTQHKGGEEGIWYAVPGGALINV